MFLEISNVYYEQQLIIFKGLLLFWALLLILPYPSHIWLAWYNNLIHCNVFPKGSLSYCTKSTLMKIPLFHILISKVNFFKFLIREIIIDMNLTVRLIFWAECYFTKYYKLNNLNLRRSLQVLLLLQLIINFLVIKW